MFAQIFCLKWNHHFSGLLIFQKVCPTVVPTLPCWCLVCELMCCAAVHREYVNIFFSWKFDFDDCWCCDERNLKYPGSTLKLDVQSSTFVVSQEISTKGKWNQMFRTQLFSYAQQFVQKDLRSLGKSHLKSTLSATKGKRFTFWQETCRFVKKWWYKLRIKSRHWNILNDFLL
jgi:hypothetical protein